MLYCRESQAGAEGPIRPGSALQRLLGISATLHVMVRDFEREQHEYRPGLRLRSLVFISDDEIELSFEGLGTADRTWRVQRRVHGGIAVINYDEEFNKLYRGIPLVSCGHSLNPLVHQAWVARGDQLPIEESWERVFEEGKAELARRWAETHPESD